MTERGRLPSGLTNASKLASPRVLIVDDDDIVREMFASYLTAQGLHVSQVSSGAALLAQTTGGQYDLLMLDLLMPGIDGLSLLRQIRRHDDVGIIIVTSRGDVIDRVAGLEAGADDYLVKPVHPREVLARIRTVLRRLGSRPPPSGGEDSENVFVFGGLELHRDHRRLIGHDGAEIELTSGEFELLLALVRHPGRPLSRDRLMDLIKGPSWAAYDRSIDQQIARLRRKIEPEPAKPRLVRSIRGVGYLFAETVERR